MVIAGGTRQDLFLKLDVRRLPEHGLENQEVPAIGRLGKTETYIDTENFHETS
jgi:hypothetical protein